MFELGILLKRISRKEEKNHLEDIVVDRSKILKWILNRICKLGIMDVKLDH